ncbi:PAS domain-containing sensor histidine kinase [Flavihumibacter fluvii]|uniref:PAS domain-containing sensor histidine kinase n=1 Tax=Flavihumibacter fluvii TaxID=2838157 RepID=UPI001BDF270D|nr:PAS domain-containing sensor histidine kinase [Flavihumibacter fluvii]ULQ51878.1 PAS domain-containing protein [Flavihumibacter fluvii]
METEQDLNPIHQLRSILASGELNEDFLLQVTDLYPALVYVYDADQRKLRYINRRITDLLGYAWEDVSKWDNDLNKIIFEEDQQLVKEELEKYYQLEGQSSYSYNCRLTHKTGDYRYFKTIGTVLRRNEKGAPASMLFMAEDITEHMQAEKEKKAARKLMDETEKMLSIGMWNWDKASGKTEWSDGMYALMGYTREEMPVIGEDFFLSHVCKPEQQDVRNKIQEAIETGKEYRLEFSVELKDGTRLFLNCLGKPELNAAGEVIRLTGISRDISDQYMQALEYKANKELQKQTEQMLNYGVFIWDIENDITTWTDGLYEIFELNKEGNESIVSYDWYLSQVEAEDRLRFDQAIKSCLNERTGFELDYSIITASGQQKIVSTKASLIKDNNNVPIRMVGNTRDITQFKKVQNELQRNLREVNRSNLELEEFAYAASHDLQEPLRKITTFGSRLQHKFASQLGDEGAMYIDRMQVAADNMRNLIDTLLELSRVTRNNQPFEKVDMNLLVKATITDLELAVDETGAEIIIGPLPIIDAIPSQLRQMFTNLLTNALKFRKPGISPLIQISAIKMDRAAKEEFFLDPEKNFYKIDIADNGIGFDQEYEQRIFQIFQRLHGKSTYPGSGIGLAICKRIAERHSGLIHAKGEEGKGAVFTVILPDQQ